MDRYEIEISGKIIVEATSLGDALKAVDREVCFKSSAPNWSMAYVQHAEPPVSDWKKTPIRRIERYEVPSNPYYRMQAALYILQEINHPNATYQWVTSVRTEVFDWREKSVNSDSPLVPVIDLLQCKELAYYTDRVNWDDWDSVGDLKERITSDMERRGQTPDWNDLDSVEKNCKEFASDIQRLRVEAFQRALLRIECDLEDYIEIETQLN